MKYGLALCLFLLAIHGADSLALDTFTIQGTIFASEPNGSAPAPSPVIQISRSSDNASASCSVQYQTQNGTASAGTDFDQTSGTITWNANETGAKDITIPIRPDTLNEGDETFTVVLMNPQSPNSAAIGSGQGTCTVTILDSTLIQLQNTSVTINEGNTTLTFFVQRLGSSIGNVSCNYGTVDSTAVANADFIPSSGSLNWGDSDTSLRSFTVQIKDDSLAEGSESFSVQLSNFQQTPGRPGGFLNTTGNITILDDDSALQLSAASYSSTEGNTVTATIQRTGSSVGSLSVDVSTADGTADGSDYVPLATTVFFNDGEVSKTVSLSLKTDGNIEADETFSLQLTNPKRIIGSGAVSLNAPATATVTIHDGIGLTQISPNQAAAGDTGLDISLTGANFDSTATVRWNGQPRPTTVVSPTQLTATIATSDFIVGGKNSVDVMNGSGPISNSLPFYVYSGPLGTWIVSNTNDSGSGSLREAVGSIRAGDKVLFDPAVFNLENSDAATLINLNSELPSLDCGSVTIDASDRRVAINGSGAGSAYGLILNSSNNVVRGLTILGFSKSGIVIQNAGSNNAVGGNRLSGQGPNGQGLRISNNGAFGIEIKGAGTNSNLIKGCWVGLDSAGLNAQPNVAGILIQGGASQNTIGGDLPGEANVISGNSFEGITFSGSGTDNNQVFGNTLGMTATDVVARATSRSIIPSRAALSNGSAGIFLSKATRGSVVGGSLPSRANVVAFNGGNGVEVHTTDTKQNTIFSNTISGNARGGIALFDGSNENVQPPAFDSVSAAASPLGSDFTRVTVSGRSINADGTVELFSDIGGQGERLMGRQATVGKAWTISGDLPNNHGITGTFTDSNGNTSTFANFGKLPPEISSPLTAVGNAGESFTYTLTAGGLQPVTFSVTGLPNGLTFSDGVISGKATQTGTFNVTITASNSLGQDTHTLLIVILNPGEGGLPTLVDSDGDGFPDDLESVLGTAPDDPASTPNGGAAAPPISLLSRVTFNVKLNFATDGNDSLKLRGDLPIAADFAFSGQSFVIDVGGVIRQFQLGGKTSRATQADAVLKFSPRTKTKTATFNLAMKKAILAAALADDGLVNADAEKLKIHVPIVVLFNGALYGVDKPLTYSARTQKSGAAK